MPSVAPAASMALRYENNQSPHNLHPYNHNNVHVIARHANFRNQCKPHNRGDLRHYRFRIQNVRDVLVNGKPVQFPGETRDVRPSRMPACVPAAARTKKYDHAPAARP